MSSMFTERNSLLLHLSAAAFALSKVLPLESFNHTQAPHDKGIHGQSPPTQNVDS